MPDITIAQFVSGHHGGSPTIRRLVEGRDWEGIIYEWNEFRPDAHGIQKPVIPFRVRKAIRAEAVAAGVILPDD